VNSNWPAAAGLFVLSPLVAEFLLGNIAIDAWYALPIIAPLYGGGAVVVRETARRLRGGWHVRGGAKRIVWRWRAARC
jgi:hypothetical protein